VHILVGVAGGLLVVLMLLEIFLAFLLPRRVKRDPLLARRIAIYLFRPWRALARRLPDHSGDTLLGIYGPLGLLLDLGLWVALLMFGYGCLQWAVGSDLAVAIASTSGRTSTSPPRPWSAPAPAVSPPRAPRPTSCRCSMRPRVSAC
jgi:hypothetical protein